MDIICEINQDNIIFTEDSRNLIVLELCDFIELPIINWAYNRPYDSIRIPEIASNILNRKPILDGIFYMNYNTVSKKYEIIDGIHRFQAIKSIMETIERSYTNEWFFSKLITVNVYYNKSKGELYDLFELINKSIPIPEIYIRDEAAEKKTCVYSVVEEWTKKYRGHFSPNIKCNIPNINRDCFINFVSIIYDKYSFNGSLENELKTLLNNTNIYIGTNIPLNSKLSEKILTKCKSSGCYLFIKKMEKIENDIDYVYKINFI